METANISGSITINLKPDYARQINWGKIVFWKRPGSEVKDFPLIANIRDTKGVSDVFYTNDKNGELLATIKVHNPDEGKKIADTISGYQGVSGVRISLGTAGPPPPSPPSA